MNTPDEEEHIEHILTKEAFIDWADKHQATIFMWMFDGNGDDRDLTPKQFYLKQHGLPLDSVIKGMD